jgi:hypothetical protein
MVQEYSEGKEGEGLHLVLEREVVAVWVVDELEKVRFIPFG